MNRKGINQTGLPYGCRRIFNLLWSSIFVLGGLVFTVIGFMQLDEVIASGSWPSTKGQVLSRRIVASETKEPNRRKETRYKPNVKYQFTVEGRIFRGDRLSISDWSFQDAAAATTAMDKLTANSQCIVFYDPENPNRSTLTAGLTAGDFLMPGLGVMCCLCGLVGGWLMAAYDRRTVERAKQKSHSVSHSAVQHVDSIDVSADMPEPKNPNQFGPRGVTLQEKISSWGREHIGSGDDKLVDWYIHASMDDGNASFVAVEPFPKIVGYARFIFVVSFAKADPVLVATYCLEEGEYLLFSSKAGPKGLKLPAKLPKDFVASYPPREASPMGD